MSTLDLPWVSDSFYSAYETPLASKWPDARVIAPQRFDSTTEPGRLCSDDRGMTLGGRQLNISGSKGSSRFRNSVVPDQRGPLVLHGTSGSSSGYEQPYTHRPKHDVDVHAFVSNDFTYHDLEQQMDWSFDVLDDSFDVGSLRSSASLLDGTLQEGLRGTPAVCGAADLEKGAGLQSQECPIDLSMETPMRYTYHHLVAHDRPWTAHSSERSDQMNADSILQHLGGSMSGSMYQRPVYEGLEEFPPPSTSPQTHLSPSSSSQPTDNTTQSSPVPRRRRLTIASTPAPLRAISGIRRRTRRAARRLLRCDSEGCDKMFTRMYELQRHQEVKHARAEQHYHCNWHDCSYSYPRHDKMVEHCRVVHKRTSIDDLISGVTDQHLLHFGFCPSDGCAWYEKRLPYLQPQLLGGV